jgi:hypothetical protein
VFVVVVGIGSAFVMLSVKRITVDLARFLRWEDVRPFCDATPVVDLVPAGDAPAPDAPRLGHRAEWDVALQLFVSQAIQMMTAEIREAMAVRAVCHRVLIAEKP